MYDPRLPLVAQSETALLRLAAIRLSLLLFSHTCQEHGEQCPDRERAEEVLEEIGRRIPPATASSR